MHATINVASYIACSTTFIYVRIYVYTYACRVICMYSTYKDMQLHRPLFTSYFSKPADAMTAKM